MPGSLFAIKAIRPRELIRSKQLQGRLLGVLQDTGYRMARDLYRTVGTWDHPVIFTIQRGYQGGDVVVQLSTDDKVFNYLDEGTGVRWAVMNDPYEPKTAPGHIGPRTYGRTYNKYGFYTAVRGRTAMAQRNLINFAYDHPIAPRRFYETVLARHERQFFRDVDRAVEDTFAGN